MVLWVCRDRARWAINQRKKIEYQKSNKQSGLDQVVHGLRLFRCDCFSCIVNTAEEIGVANSVENRGIGGEADKLLQNLPPETNGAEEFCCPVEILWAESAGLMRAEVQNPLF
jgi:hypothetical protein